MTINTQLYVQLPPCVGAEGHNFRASYPPTGQFGYVQIICTRCGYRKEPR